MQDVQENVILNLLIQYSFFFLQKLWKLSTQKIFWRPLTQIDGKRGTYNFAPKKTLILFWNILFICIPDTCMNGFMTVCMLTFVCS